jgi:hypothetical protein
MSISHDNNLHVAAHQPSPELLVNLLLDHGLGRPINTFTQHRAGKCALCLSPPSNIFSSAVRVTLG